jgi:hypothetical protein
VDDRRFHATKDPECRGSGSSRRSLPRDGHVLLVVFCIVESRMEKALMELIDVALKALEPIASAE